MVAIWVVEVDYENGDGTGKWTQDGMALSRNEARDLAKMCKRWRGDKSVRISKYVREEPK